MSQNYDTFPPVNRDPVPMTRRSLLVDFLSVLFGIGAWVSINGLWVELPLLVQELPEGWNLPSFMAIVIQVANIGPIAYSLLRFMKPSVKPIPIIYLILFTGCLASILLALTWNKTYIVNGTNHSVALLVLVFFLGLVDCTSSVLYIPYMASWKNIYLPSYLIGEGLSGLLPAIVALGQGSGGNGDCKNITDADGNTFLVPESIVPNFSIAVFFYVLFGMMVASFSAFTLLEIFPPIQKERAGSVPGDSRANLRTESVASIHDSSANVDERDQGSGNSKGFTFLFIALGWACVLANGFLPSIQSYSCGPYGHVTYHLAATLSVLANPLAALSTMILSRASVKKVGFLTVVGTAAAIYIIVTAVMSPAPPLVGQITGSAIIVVIWVIFGGVISYVRVEIANLIRLKGEKPLFWAGIVTQAGSALGALVAFFLVNYTTIFVPYQPCS